MTAHRDAVSHWDDVYAEGDASRSWFQACPLMSLTMLDAAEITASDSLIDVGGGASRLAGALLGRGFRDITVLDISVTGMRYAQDRLGEQAQQVQWLAADVLAWEPPRRFRVWHDRAVFHFLTSPPGQPSVRLRPPGHGHAETWQPLSPEVAGLQVCVPETPSRSPAGHGKLITSAFAQVSGLSSDRQSVEILFEKYAMSSVPSSVPQED